MLVTSNLDIGQRLFQFRSVPNGASALGKAHMRSIPTLRSFPNLVFDSIVRLIAMAPSRPFKEDCRAFSLSIPLSYIRSIA